MFTLGIVFQKQVGGLLSAFIAGCTRLGWKAVVAVFLVTAATNLCMLPSFPLMLGAGLIFPQMYGPACGPPIGVASVFGGMWVGSLIAFQLGRYMCKTCAEEELHKTHMMQVVNGMIDQQGWRMVMLARTSPLLPAEVFNYAVALTKITLTDYALGCCGSVIPVAIWVYSTASVSSAVSSTHRAQTQTSERNALLLVINIVVLAALSCAFWRALKQYKRCAQEQAEQLAAKDQLPPGSSDQAVKDVIFHRYPSLLLSRVSSSSSSQLGTPQGGTTRSQSRNPRSFTSQGSGILEA